MQASVLIVTRGESTGHVLRVPSRGKKRLELLMRQMAHGLIGRGLTYAQTYIDINIHNMHCFPSVGTLDVVRWRGRGNLRAFDTLDESQMNHEEEVGGREKEEVGGGKLSTRPWTIGASWMKVGHRWAEGRTSSWVELSKNEGREDGRKEERKRGRPSACMPAGLLCIIATVVRETEG